MRALQKAKLIKRGILQYELVSTLERATSAIPTIPHSPHRLRENNVSNPTGQPRPSQPNNGVLIDSQYCSFQIRPGIPGHLA